MCYLLCMLLTTACYNDYDASEKVARMDILSRFNAEGKAYLTVQIPLGGGAGTRAVTFDDGDGDEWKVRNIYILIFAGTSESNAKFASAYKVESPSLSLSAFEQVTATATITINDANLNTGDKLFPFIVVNNNTSAITTSAFPATSVAFANGGSPVVLTSSSTFADLANVTIADIKDASGYFLMTNATLADGNTTSANIFRLPEMSPTFFFPTEAESQGNPAAHISVERLAAKTTVTNSITSHYILGNPRATFASDGSDMAFALDNYNTRSYAYRHLPAVSYQRFVETASIDGHSPLAYRTYWGEDVNYSGNSGLAYTSHATYLAYTDEQKTAFWHAMGSNAYCAENTFNVSNMKDDCTTSVLVRLQLNSGLDFYTTSVTGQDIVFQLPRNEVSEEGTSASSSFSRRRSGKVTYDGTDYATIDDYLRTWLMENSSAFRTWVSTYAAGDPRHVNIAVSTPAGGGTATVTAVTQTARSSGTTGATAFNTLETTGLAAYINNNVTLKFYDDGYCYYRVPIRHFTNTETPWQSTPAMTNNTTAQAYSAAAATAAGGSGADATFLGRYGMVRNNWYDISITSVTHIGSPVIPALTTNADDKVEQLLNTTLSISGWTTHNQNL
ncbi:MAG: Mfa1 fimbrilin C-terminal domain-containing protein [Prevotella sp.]|nr:Mfa1 fimbrilin C-terminal domain-containing protein [Prevotella sp.]